MRRAIALPALLLAPAAAWAQAIPTNAPPPPVLLRPAPVHPMHPVGAMPHRLYVVINNTRRDLTCSYRWPDGAWQPWFKLARGANWEGQHGSETGLFQCRPPVSQKRYALLPGTRYSLLRGRGGKIDLVEITAGAHP
jgi:hypothetical protein